MDFSRLDIVFEPTHFFCVCCSVVLDPTSRYGEFTQAGGCLSDGNTGGAFGASFSNSRGPTFSSCLSRAPFRNAALGFTIGDLESDMSDTNPNLDARYNTVRARIESRHGSPHTLTGSPGYTMGSTYSPHDPVFYAHHTFIDLLWTRFQLLHPENHEAYDGGLNEAIEWYGESTSPSLSGQSNSDATQIISYNNPEFMNRDVSHGLHYHMVRRRLDDANDDLGQLSEKKLSGGMKSSGRDGKKGEMV
jgi:hypothetical protein